MENLSDKYAHIKGWGVDADPENDPTYPMKKYNGDDHKRIHYERRPQQQVNIEILHSNERPGVTTVFGASCPPSGLSGQLRRYAFRYSESSYLHWLPLIAADRINALEGIVDDLKKGQVPNIVGEWGWGAEWKYNRKKFVAKIAVGAVITAGIVALLCRKDDD